MKTTSRKTLMALAMATLFGTTAAYASERGNDGQDHGQSQSQVKFEKKVKLSTDIAISGDPTVSGNINVDSAAIAIVDNKQANSANEADNAMLTNDASASGNSASGSSGNIGVNIGAGDNNQQDNAAALSAADASFAFGMADAEVFVNQQGMHNETSNYAVTNSASVGDSAFSGAAGNLGVNVTSGNNNQQKNAMAASVATTSFAQASVSSDQASSHNATANQPFANEYLTSVNVSLSGSGSGTYGGSGSGSANLDLSGAVDQIGNVYPDTWTGNAHPAGTQTGHIDLDTDTQGGSDLNDDGGALAFGYTSGSQASGDVDITESGDLDLSDISLSGTVSYYQLQYLPTANTAALSGNAFQNASGNIGINISAGTGNQQANSLAMAVAQPSTGGGTPGGE